jgi:putative chitinase
MPAPAVHPAARPSRAASLPVELSAGERMSLEQLGTAGVVDTHERAMFLAQVSHESGDFRRLRENLHYSAQRLHAVFPRRIGTLEHAQELVRLGPDAIAEAVYGGRVDLGNVHPGDGALYIGRGYIQITGRANYEAAGTALGIDLVGHPELAEVPDIAARIAVWFWQRNSHIGQRARASDVAGVTRIVNGGTQGLADRNRRFRRYLNRLQQRDRLGHAAPAATGTILPR